MIADVYNPVFYFVGGTEKEHAFAPPIGEIKQVFVGGCGIGEHISVDSAEEIGLNPAKLAGKKVVGFFQGGRCPTLWALILYT